MTKPDINQFLDALEATKNTISINLPSGGIIDISPLTFKQQRLLITSGLDGVMGAMNFIKIINDIILDNSKIGDLKIYDRIPIILALRKELNNSTIIKDGVSISIDDLLLSVPAIDFEETHTIHGDGYSIKLRPPTIKQENKFLSACIDELKKNGESDITKNISTIITYEISKFVDSIEFGDNTIHFDELIMVEKLRIVDKLPADITNSINKYILEIRKYDEAILTKDGMMVDIDSSFFE